jgi:hypothetical protein
MELPEANKSSTADEPENKKKANWMQVREAVTACSTEVQPISIQYPLVGGAPSVNNTYPN